MNQLRWAIAEILIGWAMRLAPPDDAGLDLRRTLLPFLERQLARVHEAANRSTPTP